MGEYMELAGDIKTIKWLLIFILIGMFLIVMSVVGTVRALAVAAKDMRAQRQSNYFKARAEDLLAKNDMDELLNHIEKRLASHSHDVWAYWYNGQVKFHRGQYPEAKRDFTRVLEVESWMDIIEEKLDEGPKLVE